MLWINTRMKSRPNKCLQSSYVPLFFGATRYRPDEQRRQRRRQWTEEIQRQPGNQPHSETARQTQRDHGPRDCNPESRERDALISHRLTSTPPAPPLPLHQLPTSLPLPSRLAINHNNCSQYSRCLLEVDWVGQPAPFPNRTISDQQHGIRYDTRCYFNVRSKADISQLNLPHGTDN